MHKTVFYSLWYNAPKLLPAGGLECGGTNYVFGVKDVSSNIPHIDVSSNIHHTDVSSNIPHTEHIVSASTFQATGRQQLGCIIPLDVKHSLALLRVGKKLPETC